MSNQKSNNIISFDKAKTVLEIKHTDALMDEMYVFLNACITPEMIHAIGELIGYDLTIEKSDDGEDIVVGNNANGVYVTFDPLDNPIQLLEVSEMAMLEYHYDHTLDADYQHYVNCVCDQQGISVSEYGRYAATFGEALILAVWELCQVETD